MPSSVVLVLSIYGIISICTFFFFLIITAATYDEFGDGFREEFHGYREMCIAIMRMLGVFRCLCVVITALVWPVFIIAIIAFLMRIGNRHNPIPKRTQGRRILLWVFLGFGKFPSTNFYNK